MKNNRVYKYITTLAMAFVGKATITQDVEEEIARLRVAVEREKRNHQRICLQTRDSIVIALAQVEDYLHKYKPDPSTVRLQVDVYRDTLPAGWNPYRVEVRVRAIGEVE